jgi:hypothetical protein
MHAAASPLSPAAPRRHLHTRRIELCGFLREDGAVDVEAHLTDARTYSHARQDGSPRAEGDFLHDMWLRMTITPTGEILACEASMPATPYAICPQVAPNFARLTGLRVEAGFLKRALERVGGAEGCTHLRELLQQVGTVYLQTRYSIAKLQPAATAAGHADKAPRLLNSCYAWGEGNQMVAQHFPAWHKTSSDPKAIR